MSKVAMCDCGEPLVMTFVYFGKEFVCVVCGATYTFFGPTPAAETPELRMRIKQRKAEWQALTDGLLNSCAYHRDCPKCDGGEYHIQHATQAELAASVAARERMAARRLWVGE